VSDIIGKDKVAFAKCSKVDVAIEGGFGSFVLFSSMCEQKVSTYMPSWALLVMTAVCKEVRKKTVKVLTRIKQKLNNNMSIKTKTKNK
jgi:hypothetical protein